MKCDICDEETDDTYDELFNDMCPCYCNIINALKEKDDEIRRLKNDI